MPLPTSWSTHEAAAQEIEARSAEHLTLEHLETIDMPLHRTGTPGQGHAGFDRVIVFAELLGEALQSLQRTGGGGFQLGIELLRLPLAHEPGKVLGQVDGLSDFGLLGAQRRELLRLCCRALLLAPEHEPGRTARGEGIIRGFGDDR
jgi:hypothetical protein